MANVSIPFRGFRYSHRKGNRGDSAGSGELSQSPSEDSAIHTNESFIAQFDKEIKEVSQSPSEDSAIHTDIREVVRGIVNEELSQSPSEDSAIHTRNEALKER